LSVGGAFKEMLKWIPEEFRGGGRTLHFRNNTIESSKIIFILDFKFTTAV
jgi:hypothetical protein